MADINKTEVTAGALFREGTPGIPATDEEVLAAKIGETAQRDYEESLTFDVESTRKLDAKGIETLRDKIGVEDYDNDGNRERTQDERDRLDELDVVIEQYDKYMKGGDFNAMEDHFKNQFISFFEHTIKDSDVFKRMHAGLNSTQKADFYSRVFNREDFRRMFRKQFFTYADRETSFADVNAAKQAEDIAEKELEAQKKAEEEAKETLEGLKKEEDSFKVGDPDDNDTWGENAKKIAELEQKIESQSEDLDVNQEKAKLAEQKYETAKKTLENLINSGRLNEGGINEYQGKIVAAYEELRTVQKPLEELAATQEELKTLTDRKKALPGKINEAETALANAQAETAKKTAAYQETQRKRVRSENQRVHDETEYIHKLIREPAEKSVREWTKKETGDIATIGAEDIREFTEQMKEGNERLVKNYIDGLFIDASGKKPLFDVDNIAHASKELARYGPQALLEKYIDRIPTGTGAGQMTQAQKDELKKNNEFMEGMQKTMAETIFQSRGAALFEHSQDRFFGLGKSDAFKKLTYSQAEIALLKSKPWGKELIEKAQTATKEAERARQQLIDQGTYDFSSTSEWLRHYSKKVPAGKIALILLALAITAGGGLAAL